MDEFEKHSARPVQGRMGENHLPRPEDTCGQGCCLGTKQSVAATATSWTELGTGFGGWPASGRHQGRGLRPRQPYGRLQAKQILSLTSWHLHIKDCYCLGPAPKARAWVFSHRHQGALCPPCTTRPRSELTATCGGATGIFPLGCRGLPGAGLGPRRPTLGEGGWRWSGFPPGPGGTFRQARTLGARPGSRGQRPSGREAAPPEPEPTSYFTTRGELWAEAGPAPSALCPAREGWGPGLGSGCSRQDGGRGRC